MKALKLMALAGLALAACENIEPKDSVTPTENEARPLTISIGTKAGLPNELKEGSVGFFDVLSAAESPNREIRFENGKWNVVGEPIMYMGSDIFYFAYYPYEEGFIDTSVEFTGFRTGEHKSVIPAEQTEENIKATEFLCASNLVSSEKLDIQFQRAHCLIIFDLQGSDANVESMTLKGPVVEATFTSNIKWEVPETSPVIGDVKLCKTSDTTFEGILIPHPLQDGELKINVIENGENITYSAGLSVPFDRGRRYTIPVNLEKTKADGAFAVLGQIEEEIW